MFINNLVFSLSTMLIRTVNLWRFVPYSSFTFPQHVKLNLVTLSQFEKEKLHFKIKLKCKYNSWPKIGTEIH